MKKFLPAMLLACTLGLPNAHSQDVIINGSFEEWTATSPVEWMCLYNYSGFQNVYQSTDAHDGMYSADMKPTYSNTVQAIPPAHMISGIFPVTAAHGSLYGWFKGQASGQDSLYIMVILFENSVPVAAGYYITNATASSWTSFQAPIEYYTEAVPNEGYISIFAGSSETGTEGTSYKVDHLTFGGTAARGELQAAREVKLSPNPAGETLTLAFSLESSDRLTIRLVNPQGAVVLEDRPAIFLTGQNTYTLRLTGLAPGLYFLQVTGEKFRFSEKVLVGK